MKVSPFRGHSWSTPLSLRTQFLKHLVFRPSQLFLWMVIFMTRAFKVEYKNGPTSQTYRNINQLGTVYFFQTSFPASMFIKIKINLLPTNSLNYLEYADIIRYHHVMIRKWTRSGRWEIKEQKLHLRASEMWHLENAFTPSQITSGLMCPSLKPSIREC